MSAVVWSREGDVHVVRLTRPERRNAIDHDFSDELLAAVRAVGDARVILLLADGDHFSVGGDINDFASAEETGPFIRGLATALHRAVLALAEAPVPVVAGVQGWAAGAGFSLVLGADLVVAGESTRFRPAYPGIGLSPDGGMSWLLPRSVGRARALRILLTDEVLTAAQAADLGLVAQVVPDDRIAESAAALAAAVAAVPGDAAGATRALVNAAPDRSLAEHLEAEAASIAARSEHPDSLRLVRAFLDRASRSS